MSRGTGTVLVLTGFQQLRQEAGPLQVGGGELTGASLAVLVLGLQLGFPLRAEVRGRAPDGVVADAAAVLGLQAVALAVLTASSLQDEAPGGWQLTAAVVVMALSAAAAGFVLRRPSAGRGVCTGGAGGAPAGPCGHRARRRAGPGRLCRLQRRDGGRRHLARGQGRLLRLRPRADPGPGARPQLRRDGVGHRRLGDPRAGPRRAARHPLADAAPPGGNPVPAGGGVDHPRGPDGASARAIWRRRPTTAVAGSSCCTRPCCWSPRRWPAGCLRPEGRPT